MPTSNPSRTATPGSSTACRLLLGVPILCILTALFAYVFWAIHGFPTELAPRHWLDDDGLSVLVMGFFGGITVTLTAWGVWIFGVIAMALGERAIVAWQRLRRAARPAHAGGDRHG